MNVHQTKVLADAADPVGRGCLKCNCPRKGLVCKKCGTPTVVPPPDWEYPAMPDIERIRALCAEVGYSLGVHGSLERDLDVIAAPWDMDAIGNQSLLAHVAAGMTVNGSPARILEVTRKPLGRYAASIQMDGYFKVIDISVCPTI
jgi:hypothetical protein